MQLNADVPVGVFLSGGLDSSLVAYYISKVKKLKSFSIGFENTNYDESEYAKAVADKLGTDHYSETFVAGDVISIFDEISPKLDEPFADASLFPTYKVSKLARKHVKVVLSGDGADELFGGYPTYQAHLISKYLDIFPKSAIDLMKSVLRLTPNTLIDLIPLSFKDYPKKHLASILLDAVKKSDLERHLYFMRTFFLGNRVLHGKPNFSVIDDYIPSLKNVDITRKAQIFDVYTYLRDDFFFKVDRASMYNSLEVRVPYMDNDVVDYALSTKRDHVTLTKTKIMLREILEDKLPKIAKRPKKGFGIPLEDWLRNDLKEFSYEKLKNDRLFDYIPKRKIDTVWTNHQQGSENNSGTIWMLMVLSEWMRNWL